MALVLACGSAPANEKYEAELQRVQKAYNARQDNDAEQIHCKMEAKIGTRIKRPVCRTNALLRQQQIDTQLYLRKPRLSVTRNDSLGF